MEFDYLVHKELTDRLEMLVNGLSRGAPSDYPEYCKLVGEIQGVRYALSVVAAARSKVLVDED